MLEVCKYGEYGEDYVPEVFSRYLRSAQGDKGVFEVVKVCPK
jgi:hypothetical protein